MKKFRVFNDVKNYFVDRFFSSHEDAERCIMCFVRNGEDIDNFTIKEFCLFYK